VQEQQRIAEVLSACDREIELLQKQLKALKEQKGRAHAEAVDRKDQVEGMNLQGTMFFPLRSECNNP